MKGTTLRVRRRAMTSLLASTLAMNASGRALVLFLYVPLLLFRYAARGNCRVFQE
jgi:hypothetical protein